MKGKLTALTAACIALSAILCGCEEAQQEIIITEVIAGTVTSPEAAEETDFIPEENDRSDVSPEYVPQKSLITAAPSKEDVWHMLLNSVDYYNYASGRIAYTAGDMAFPVVVEFECSIPDSVGYSHFISAEVFTETAGNAAENSDIDLLLGAATIHQDVTATTENFINTRADNIEKTINIQYEMPITRDNVSDIPDDQRYGTYENGTNWYSLRTNPTQVDIAAICLCPQEITLGYLKDFALWDIDGREEYAGRDCLVISGESSKDYGGKLGTESFIFYVDTETGCLLKYLGMDSSGEVADYLISDSISFESSGELSDRISAALEKAVGYTEE